MVSQLYIEPSLLLTDDQENSRLVSPDIILRCPKDYLIVGQPGSGKTSLLNYLYSRIDKAGREIYGLYLRPSDFSSYSGFLDYCEEEIKKISKNKQVYVFCDGIDEYPERKILVDDLLHLKEKYTFIYLILSSKDYGPFGHNLLSSFALLEIELFNDQKVSEYLQSYFGKHYHKIASELSASTYIKKWLNNPLLLKIFVMVISEYEIPVQNMNPTALLELYVEQSLSEFSKSRKSELLPSYNYDEKNLLFEKLAVYCALEKKHIVSVQEFRERILRSDESLLSNRDEEELFTYILNLPLLTVNEQGVSFVHMSVFEYFLARSMVQATGKETFSMSVSPESIHASLYFSRPKSKANIIDFTSEKLKRIKAYDTGTDILYAKAGSIDLGLAIVLAPGVFYCFMKFADSFFGELGKIFAQKVTNSKEEIVLPPHIEAEMPYWIREDSNLKKEYLTELTKRYANNQDANKFAISESHKHGKELAEIALGIALKDKKHGVTVRIIEIEK